MVWEVGLFSPLLLLTPLHRLYMEVLKLTRTPPEWALINKNYKLCATSPKSTSEYWAIYGVWLPETSSDFSPSCPRLFSISMHRIVIRQSQKKTPTNPNAHVPKMPPHKLRLEVERERERCNKEEVPCWEQQMRRVKELCKRHEERMRPSFLASGSR